MYTITNAFAEGKYNEIYKDRFPTSESINGKNGILHLLCRDLTANQNEILFRGLLYNLKRINNLKGTSSWFCYVFKSNKNIYSEFEVNNNFNSIID